MLSDDGSFESLCNRNHYVFFIQELVDCWIESRGRPEAYPDVPEDEWIKIAESLLDDIDHGSSPSHSLWNVIYTLRCEQCSGVTRLADGQFYCDACRRPTVFRAPNVSNG